MKIDKGYFDSQKFQTLDSRKGNIEKRRKVKVNTLNCRAEMKRMSEKKSEAFNEMHNNEKMKRTRCLEDYYEKMEDSLPRKTRCEDNFDLHCTPRAIKLTPSSSNLSSRYQDLQPRIIFILGEKSRIYRIYLKILKVNKTWVG